MLKLLSKKLDITSSLTFEAISFKHVLWEATFVANSKGGWGSIELFGLILAVMIEASSALIKFDVLREGCPKGFCL